MTLGLVAIAVTTVPAPALADELPAAAARLLSPTGEVITLDQLFGPEPLVVNLWATWCVPCRTELPMLADLHAWLEPRGGAVVLIAAEPSLPEPINAFLHERVGVTSLDSYVDRAGLVAAAFQVRLYPTTVILDASGTVLEIVQGAADWNGPDMHDHLGQWLAPGD